MRRKKRSFHYLDETAKPASKVNGEFSRCDLMSHFGSDAGSILRMNGSAPVFRNSVMISYGRWALWESSAPWNFRSRYRRAKS